MIIFDGFELVGVAIMGAAIIILCIVSVIDRIAYAVKKRQQNRIDNAFEKEGNE